uniref:Uncharacterized protein n=1 Tax=Daphnia magna TaxID=35525 RepID=A0A0P6HB05_9CRUS
MGRFLFPVRKMFATQSHSPGFNGASKEKTFNYLLCEIAWTSKCWLSLAFVICLMRAYSQMFYIH